MSTITCTRRVQFCAGHRVVGHESKCRNLHGHNYVALFTAEADVGNLDEIGRVIDFSVLKERIGGWIDANWDHGLVLYTNDQELSFVWRGTTTMPGMEKWYRLPTNPTAENMANYLLKVICPRVLAGTGVRVTSVRLWETENCYADATEV